LRQQQLPIQQSLLIVSIQKSQRIYKVDTLEYQMASPDGTLLGEGFTDIKESKIVLQRKCQVQRQIIKLV
jgi:hypothetical protein